MPLSLPPPAASPDDWTRRFTALLQQQLDHYESIHQLATQQRESITTSDTEALMSVLATKQEHIRTIEQIESQFGDLHDRWDKEYEQLTTATRAPIQAIITRLREVLGEIVADEDQDRAALEATKTETASDLNRVQKGKALTKAYGKPKLPPIARYKDDQA